MLTDIKLINNGLLSVRISKRCAGSDCCLKHEPERLLKEIKYLCVKNNVNKVLINACRTCDESSNTYAQFELGKIFAKVINGSGIMTGVYGNCSYFTHFTETVAVNRGSVIKVSDKKDELIKWFDLDISNLQSSTFKNKPLRK